MPPTLAALNRQRSGVPQDNHEMSLNPRIRRFVCRSCGHIATRSDAARHIIAKQFVAQQETAA